MELRTKEPEIAKAKSKEAAAVAKAVVEAARKKKEEAARLQAKAEEDDRRLRTEFVGALVVHLDSYLLDVERGKDRIARCQKKGLWAWLISAQASRRSR